MAGSGIGNVARGLFLADRIQLVGLILIGIAGEKAIWDADADEALFEARDRRGRKLIELGALAVFPGGQAVLAGPGGSAWARAVSVVVTVDRFVLLPADQAFDPDTELGSIRRSAVVGAEAVDETGRPIGPEHLTPEAELEGPRRFAVTVALREGDAEGSAVFLFPAASTALEASDRFRAYIESDPPSRA
jgi:hypothetical protein